VAGIGFELRRILNRDTFGAQIQAYFLGMVIVLGPFLCSASVLIALSTYSVPYADLSTRQIFTGAVVYVFGGSLIITGLVQIVLARFIADKIYRGEYDTIIASYFPVLVMTSALLILSGVPAVYFFDIPLVAKVLIVSLYTTIGCLWVTVIYVDTTQGYRSVVAIFVVGSIAAFAAGITMLEFFGLEGLLAGYALGHAFMLILLMQRLLHEFGFPRNFDWGLLRYMKLFPLLVIIGVVHNLGVWIDKIIFWTSELAVSSAGIVTAPKYDSAAFLGFLTTLPAITHFFVRLEADFSSNFQRYYDEVFFRSPFEDIASAAENLRISVFKAFISVITFQSMFSFLCAFFGEELLTALGLPVSQVGMFRYGVAGSLFLVFLLFSVVILMYLDRQREILVSVVSLLVLNTVLSLVTLDMGYQYYGLGFAVAALVSMLIALVHLTNQLYSLEYMTFASIPVLGQRRAKDKLRARRGGMYGRYNPLIETRPRR
jgi:uncharacterized membrane protein